MRSSGKKFEQPKGAYLPMRRYGEYSMTVPVNSFDEWSPLKEVVVGSPVNFKLPDIEISFEAFFYENAHAAFYYPSYSDGLQATAEGDLRPRYEVKRRYLEELNEDVESFAATLRSLGIVVHRPVTLPEVPRFSTPYWEASSTPALNVRDQAIVMGREIIETPPQIRARYFENDLLKPIFYRYFEAGSSWCSMPRPVMTDNSFDLSYIEEVGRQMVATQAVPNQEASPYDVGYEIMIDAAQFIRLGKDILVNVATRNHELGLTWMLRHFGDKYNFHRLDRITDNHIDSIILPLRPGLLLLRHPRFLEMLPASLQKWDVVYAPEPDKGSFPEYDGDDLVLSSKYIDLNVLSVDENTVVVNSLFPDLIKLLEEGYGFDVVPVQHRHRRLFGGGFHCFTLDTVREGSLEDYFS